MEREEKKPERLEEPGRETMKPPMAEQRDSVDIPPTETPAPQPERVFNREVITPEDLKAVAREVSELLRDEQPDSTLRAARELVDLKRAKVHVAAEHKERVFGKLRAQREAILRNKAVDNKDKMRYLTHLKYIGALEDINDDERVMIDETINDRTAQGGLTNSKTRDLSLLLVQAKYLGVEKDSQALEGFLAEEVEFVRKPGEEHRIAYRLARAKYLGVASPRFKQYEATMQGPVDAKLAEFRATGDWEQFARLQEVIIIHRGGIGEPSLNDKAQEQTVQYIRTMRERGSQEGRWGRFVSYIGTLMRLSERLRNREEAEAQLIAVVEDPTPETPEPAALPETEAATGSVPLPVEEPTESWWRLGKKLRKWWERRRRRGLTAQSPPK